MGAPVGARGGPHEPLSQSEIDAKFGSVGRPLPDAARTGELRQTLTRFLREPARVSDLADLLGRPASGCQPAPEGSRTEPRGVGLPDLHRPARRQRARGPHPDGLPVGLRLVGRRCCDWHLLAVAHAFEAATGHEAVMPVSVPAHRHHTFSAPGE